MPRELFCFSHHSGVFSLCMVGFYTLMGRFLYFSRIAGAPLLHQPGIYLSRLISRAFFFSPDTFSPAMARRYTIRQPHCTYSNGSRLRNCASPFVHSTLSPLLPVYPSPEHGTPAAASLHTPGWQGTRSTSPS